MTGLSSGAKAILRELRGSRVGDFRLVGHYARIFGNEEERRACVRELVSEGLVEEFGRNEAVALTPKGADFLNST